MIKYSSDVGCLNPAINFFVDKATLSRLRIDGEVADEASGYFDLIQFKA